MMPIYGDQVKMLSECINSLKNNSQQIAKPVYSCIGLIILFLSSCVSKKVNPFVMSILNLF